MQDDTIQSDRPELFPYQEEGARFMAARRFAYNADTMGIGKTAQAIRACDLVGARRVLVVCPASVRANWETEFLRFQKLDRPISVMYSGKDKPCPDGVTVVSYDLLTRKAVREKLDVVEGFVLITDENHYLKNRTAGRTKAVLGHRKQKGLVDRAERWYPLSGTPAPNYPDELWTTLRKGGVFDGDYWSFVDRYCVGYESGFGFRITGGKNFDELRSLMRPHMIRRTKEEVLKDLPPIKFSYHTVDAADVDWEVFFPYPQYGPMDYIKREIQTEAQATMAVLQKVDGIGNKLLALESMNGVNTAQLRKFIGLTKVPGVVDLVREELRGTKKKMVLFAVHRDVIKLLQLELDEFKPQTIYGGTPAEKRQKKIDRFRDKEDCQVFIGQVIAAGTGINLTCAHEVLLVEASWVPGDNAQAVMRCHRIGQKHPVNVRFVTARNVEVENKVTYLLKRKAEQLTQLFD